MFFSFFLLFYSKLCRCVFLSTAACFVIFCCLLVCICLCTCFVVVPAFFSGSYYSKLFFLGEVYVFLFNLLFCQLGRCVALATNDLSGEYLLCFCDIVFMYMIPCLYCIFLCVISQYLGGNWHSLCFLYFLFFFGIKKCVVLATSQWLVF